MCDSRQPLNGADSVPYWERPGPIQCGTWVEREDSEGFCSLAPDHSGACEPPPYESIEPGLIVGPAVVHWPDNIWNEAD